MPEKPFTIAVSGKGGTGKTTVSSLLIRSFITMGETPVLAVDADPNANEIRSLREKIEKAKLPDEARKAANQELERMAQTSPAAAEYAEYDSYDVGCSVPASGRSTACR